MEGGSEELIPSIVKRYPAPALTETAISKLSYNCDNTTKQKAFSTRLLTQETPGFSTGPIEVVLPFGSEGKSYSFWWRGHCSLLCQSWARWLWTSHANASVLHCPHLIKGAQKGPSLPAGGSLKRYNQTPTQGCVLFYHPEKFRNTAAPPKLSLSR